MSLKFTILNVSYDKKQHTNKSHLKERRSISRYSEYTQRNKFIDHQRRYDLSKRIKTPDEQYFQQENKKFSLYQQYKKKQFHNRIKMHSPKRQQNNYSQIMVRGYIKQKSVTNNNNNHKIIQQFSDIDMSHILHSSNKEFSSGKLKGVVVGMTPRRKLSIPSPKSPQMKNCFIASKPSQPTKAIGILGVKTSFLDKYRLKLQNSDINNEQHISEQFKTRQYLRKLNRRQILCSTRQRNRTIQPRNIRTSYTRSRNDKNNQLLIVDKNYLTLQMQDKIDRIQCRPWSPTKDEQFQKI